MRPTARPNIRHLAASDGTLQFDGYAGFKVLAARTAVSFAFCWAHVRRRFHEMAKAGPAPIAIEALTGIAELARTESENCRRSPEERRAMRQDRSRPVEEALDPWLTFKVQLISQNNKLAEAIWDWDWDPPGLVDTQPGRSQSATRPVAGPGCFYTSTKPRRDREQHCRAGDPAVGLHAKKRAVCRVR